MPFADLETLALADYLAHEARIEGPWLFLHLPATGGTRLSAALEARMQPFRRIEPRSGAVTEFLCDLARAPHPAAALRSNWAVSESLRVGRPDLRLVTLLRDPVARVQADYQARLAQGGDFGQRFPDLIRWAETPGAQDVQADHLVGKAANPSPETVIDRLRQGFAFVGLTELLPQSLAAILAAMGRARPPEPARPEPAWPEPAWPDPVLQALDPLPDRLAAMIREMNPLDQAAYDYVRTVLRRHGAPGFA